MNVTLRAVVEADLPVLFEHQTDEVALRMAAFPSRDREAFQSHWAKILAESTVQPKAVLVDGQLAGYVVAHDHGGKRLVGYWIGREFWGRGIATKALAAFLNEETLRPLYADVAKNNIGSVRVLQKCGFTVVGEAKGDDGIEELTMRLDERGPSMRVNYAIVFVSDMSRALAFYRDVLGLPLKFESPHWTEFATDGATLALHASEGPGGKDDPRKAPAGRCRPGLSVPDLDAFHARMVEHGVTCIQEPRSVFGARVALYLDPDGLGISVGEAPRTS